MNIIKAIEDFTYYHNVTGQDRKAWEEWRIKAVEEWQLDRALIEKGEKGMVKLTPMKAIRKKCLDCCCGQVKEVRLCLVKNCALYEYRNGHRPKGEEIIAESE